MRKILWKSFPRTFKIYLKIVVYTSPLKILSEMYIIKL